MRDTTNEAWWKAEPGAVAVLAGISIFMVGAIVLSFYQSGQYAGYEAACESVEGVYVDGACFIPQALMLPEIDL